MLPAPVAGTFICFARCFNPNLATIADISTSILGSFCWRLFNELPGCGCGSLDSAALSNFLSLATGQKLGQISVLPKGLTATFLTHLHLGS